MRIKLHAPDQTEIPKLRAYLKERLWLDLSQLSHRIERVTVWLQNLNGPRGDRRCFIRVKLLQGKDVVAEADASHMILAIDSASGRVHRSVRRSLRLPFKK